MNNFHKFAIKFILMSAIVGFILMAIAGYSAVRPHVMDLRGTNVIDIRNYGAKPDDDIDDTLAIQSAIASLTNGSIFRVPKGRYLTQSSMTFDDLEDITFEWEGVITSKITNAPQYLITIGLHIPCNRFKGFIKIGETYTRYDPPKNSVTLPSTTGAFLYNLTSSDLCIDSNGFGKGLETNVVTGSNFRLGQFYSNEIGIDVGLGGTYLGGSFLYPSSDWLSSYPSSYAIVTTNREAIINSPTISGNVNFLKVGGWNNKVNNVIARYFNTIFGNYNNILLYDNSSYFGNEVSFSSSWEKEIDSVQRLELTMRKIDNLGYISGDDIFSIVIDSKYAKPGMPYVLHNIASDTYEQGILIGSLGNNSFVRSSSEEPLEEITSSNISNYEMYLPKVDGNPARTYDCTIINMRGVNLTGTAEKLRQSSYKPENIQGLRTLGILAKKSGEGLDIRSTSGLLSDILTVSAGLVKSLSIEGSGTVNIGAPINLKYGTSRAGVFACLNSASTTTISSINTWTALQGTFSNNPINLFSLQADKLRYDGTTTRTFEIDYNTSFVHSTVNSLVEYGVSINGVASPCSISGVTSDTGANDYSTSGKLVINLIPGDEVQLVVRSDKTGTLTTKYFTTAIKEWTVQN